MTPEEHRLVIWVMVRQSQQIKTLFDILKSRGVLEEGDSEAFACSVFLDEASNSSLLREAKDEYANLAKQLGVETGLEKKA